MNDAYMPHIVALVAAAVGAFLGSGSAFVLEAWRRQREETEARYSALFRTQLVLITQLNTLLVINKQYLDAHREDPERFMKLVPFHTGMTGMRVDFGSLWFIPLIDSDADLVHRIYLAEQAYSTSTDTLAMRNRKIEETMYASDVRVEQFDFSTGNSRVQLDMRKVHLIKSLTDCLYESIDDAIKQQEKAIADIRLFIKRVYRGRKSLQYTDKEPNKKKPEST